MDGWMAAGGLPDLSAVLMRPLPQVWRIGLLFAAPFLGSFLGLLAQRLPEGRPVLWARSACDSCGTRLGPTDLVPVISFLVLRGRCRYCGAAIPAMTLWAELLTLGMVGWALWALGSAAPAGLVLGSVFLGAVLLLMSLIDAEHFYLPDMLTLPLVLLGLGITALLTQDLLGMHAAAAAIGYGLIWLLRAVYLRLRQREGIGLGDAKLLAAAGAWAGPLGLPSVLLLGSLSGLGLAVVMRLRGETVDGTTRIPFGPFLALGLWVTWLHGPVSFG